MIKLATLLLGFAGLFIGLGILVRMVIREVSDLYWNRRNKGVLCEEDGCIRPRAKGSLWCRWCARPKRRGRTPLGVEKLPRYLNG